MSRRLLLNILFVLVVVLGALVLVRALEEQEAEIGSPPAPTLAGPPQPAGSVHLALGNPSGAVSDPGQPANYLISRDQYALAYHRDRGTAIWVSWHLQASDLGDVERYSGPFIPDSSLPSGWYQVRHGDYTGSGYDRGHMVPSADRTASPADNQATFILTNILPQAPANNQGPWADLENYLRDQVRSGDEAYIIAGPQGTAGTIAGGAVTVPAAVWKVAVLLPAGENDLARMGRDASVIAVLMPNDQSVEGRSWREYTTSVACIEALTGLDLLDALEDSVEAALAGESCPANGLQPTAPASTGQGVTIVMIDYNPPGDDLAGEHVLLQNTGSRAITLTGWTLEDEARTIYTFPSFTLGPGARVRVWVRAGTDDDENLYWGRSQPVWNNSGDVGILRDASGREVARFAY